MEHVYDFYKPSGIFPQVNVRTEKLESSPKRLQWSFTFLLLASLLGRYLEADCHFMGPQLQSEHMTDLSDSGGVLEACMSFRD